MREPSSRTLSFRYHVSLFVFSLFIVCGVFILSGYEWRDAAQAEPPRSDAILQYIDRYDTGTKGKDGIAQVKQAINERSILLFGSSELSMREEPMIPYRFFNDSLAIPFLAIGHAGFQSFTVFAQLAGLDFEMENYPLVILISPGWFHDKSAGGTSLELFFESAPEPFLYSIYFSKNLPDEFKEYTGEYIHRRLPDINNPNAILKALNYNYETSRSPFHRAVFFPPAYASGWYCEKQKANKGMEKFTGAVNNKAAPHVSSRQIPDSLWNEYYASCLAKHREQSSNNEWSVENNYYDAWLRNSGKKKVYPVAGSGMQEMEDLRMLLKFLAHKKASPLFIIQPLNPFAYENLQELDPVMKQVEAELKKYNYPSLNLWTVEQKEYRPGTLKDVMHLGAAGWCLVNKKIQEYYQQLQHEKK